MRDLEEWFIVFFFVFNCIWFLCKMVWTSFVSLLNLDILLYFLLFSDADMEDYGFEYSEEEPEEQDVDIENQYYNSKGKNWNCIYGFCYSCIWVIKFFSHLSTYLLDQHTSLEQCIMMLKCCVAYSVDGQFSFPTTFSFHYAVFLDEKLFF